ncbi:MAG: hypothetical protein EBY62_01005 [Cellvibrionales bacterium]|nr:hypothetical protein [Cellvibrionales bacterium]
MSVSTKAVPRRLASRTPTVLLPLPGNPIRLTICLLLMSSSSARVLMYPLVAFSGYEMPVQFAEGIIREHLHTRDAAGLFDVSHMGQIMVTGDRAAVELETLMPANLLDLSVGQSTYSLLTTLNGGVYDDLIVTRDSETSFYLVVNGACKAKDLELIAAGCPTSSVGMLQERALLALQGPQARPVIGALAPEASSLTFMSGCHASILETPCYVTCSGYTGEDGFELSVPA